MNETRTSLEVNDALATSAPPLSGTAELLARQYQATLMMLKDTIEKCPDGLWSRETDRNQFWQTAYHALYFTHFYTQPTSDAFVRWSGQHAPAQNDDGLGYVPDPKSALPYLPEPYTKEEVLAYWQYCWDNIAQWVGALDLSHEESGFSWYPMPKLEHQLVTLRHLSQHMGQLTERLRQANDIGTPWRGTWPPRKA
jgi:hypothetical protein